MGDLVRRIRLEVACSNLDRIAKLNDEVKRRDAWLSRLQGTWDPSVQNVKTVVNKLGEIKNDLDSINLEIETNAPQLPFADQLQQAASDLGALKQDLGNALRELNTIRWETRRLRSGMVNAPVEESQLLGELVRRAGKIRENAEQSTLWTSSDDKASIAWQAECEAMFDEYVAVLCGIALRDAGFGDARNRGEDGTYRIGDLFAIADLLPDFWGPVGRQWRSLAVPARIEHAGGSTVQVIRLGFPEWTVWALPLAQGEFAHVFVTDRTTATKPPAHRQLLADAAATLLTGPAYAAAAVLLRIDPARVRRNTPEARRSATILHALSVVADQRDDPDLTSWVGLLRDEWRDAIVAARGDRDAFDQHASSDLAIESFVSQARERLADQQALRSETDLPVWAERWTEVSAAAELLREGRVDQIDARTRARATPPVGLILILNAAWIARIGLGAGAAADASDQIAASALDLLHDIAAPGEATTGLQQIDGTGSATR